MMPEGQNGARRNKTEDDLTAEVLARFSGTQDPRLREIMLSLISHLHAFVKEVKLTEAEWFQAIEILTEAGKMCSDKRQEFILFSDTLGVSMVVDLLDHRKPDGATESTVFGPFHRLGAPEMPMGGNIAHRDRTGTPTLVRGRVLDLDGKPVANALLDVWQTQSNGLYDAQDEKPNELVGRAGGPHAEGDRAASLAARAYSFRRVGRRLRAGHDAYFRPYRRVSAKRCGIRGQGHLDLRFHKA